MFGSIQFQWLTEKELANLEVRTVHRVKLRLIKQGSRWDLEGSRWAHFKLEHA